MENKLYSVYRNLLSIQKVEFDDEKFKNPAISIVSTQNFNTYVEMKGMCEKLGFSRVEFSVGKNDSAELFVREQGTLAPCFRFYLSKTGNKYKCAIGARHDILSMFERKPRR